MNSQKVVSNIVKSVLDDAIFVEKQMVKYWSSRLYNDETSDYTNTILEEIEQSEKVISSCNTLIQYFGLGD